MRPRFATLAASCGALLLWCVGLHAQGPVTRELQRLEERAARNVSEAAEAMPEDRYAFKPTPAQMTFGEVVLHVAEYNTFLCSSIAGTPVPDQRRLLPTDSKDKLVDRLEDSFDLCNATLEHADDSFLEDSVPYFGGRKTNRAAALIELATLWADHYSQLAIYIRLNGMEPPTAKRKK
jgi:DinB family protein